MAMTEAHSLATLSTGVPDGALWALLGHSTCETSEGGPSQSEPANPQICYTSLSVISLLYC